MKSPHTPSPVVLLVEDDAGIRRFVRTALESEGCTAHEATALERGRIELASRRPDLLVLDLGLPDGDGMTLLAELRGWSGMPVLVLSARSDEADKVAALDAGADDYLAKPFGVGEFLARVRALLRRALRPAQAAARIAFGDVELDLEQRRVTRAGVPVHLTPIEFRLLSLLAAASLPLGLLCVGAALKPEQLSGEIPALGWNSALRLLTMPLLAWTVAWALALPAMDSAVLVLFFALPTAPTAYVLTRQLGGDSQLMAGIITLQTLLAAGSLVAIMLLLA